MIRIVFAPLRAITIRIGLSNRAHRHGALVVRPGVGVVTLRSRRENAIRRQTQIERVCGGTPIPCNGPTDLQAEACVEAIYRRNQVSNPEDLPSECVLCM